VTPVVIDASAGVELAADTVRGRALRRLLPADAVPWIPELFYVECGAVLRRWGSEPDPDVRADQPGHRGADGLAAANHVGTRIVHGRVATSTNGTLADARSVALAEHLGADLLPYDIPLANTRPAGPGAAPAIGIGNSSTYLAAPATKAATM
jgi:predicted nucleic acid-binding protein